MEPETQASSRMRVLERAAKTASEAAAAAGVLVRPLLTLDQFGDASRVMAASFKFDIADDFLFAQLSSTENYVFGAYADSSLVAASMGFFGKRRGVETLHSLLTGVSPAIQHRGVGFALKLHQRAWALEREVNTITWTFDPLLRRNAYFNVVKLGAHAVAYFANMFGPAHGLYERHDSDCLLVEWNLGAASTLDPDQRKHDLSLDDLRAKGARAVLRRSAQGTLVTDSASAPILLCQIPADVVALRQQEPQLAVAWQVAARAALVSAFANGYAITDFLKEGWYVLMPDPERRRYSVPHPGVAP